MLKRNSTGCNNLHWTKTIFLKIEIQKKKTCSMCLHYFNAAKSMGLTKGTGKLQVRRLIDCRKMVPYSSPFFPKHNIQQLGVKI